MAAKAGLETPAQPVAGAGPLFSPGATVTTWGAVLKDVEREWLQMRFKGAFHEKRGTAFQDWFAEIMAAAYPGDFQRVRPYGKRGDLKCDGFLRSTGGVYQSYAPREMKLPQLLKKIAEDFSGAKKNWKNEMKAWTFVHNDIEGLPADAVKAIEKLRTANQALAIAELTYEGLEKLVLGLPEVDRVRLFGRPPTRKDFDTVGFEQLAVVLSHPANVTGPTVDVEIKPVSPKKLEANALSLVAAGYLTLGRQREALVEEYFAKHPNPAFGEDIANAFRTEYRRLRVMGYDADRVFAALQEFASGNTRGALNHEAAVLSVLSYLFERCDIFEPPPQGAAT